MHRRTADSQVGVDERIVIACDFSVEIRIALVRVLSQDLVASAIEGYAAEGRTAETRYR